MVAEGLRSCDRSRPGGYKFARMIRVRHLHDGETDFQTRRGIEALTRSLGAGFDASGERVGGVPGALLRRDRTAVPADVVHAWGGRALAAAVLRGGGRIVFSPTKF